MGQLLGGGGMGASAGAGIIQQALMNQANKQRQSQDSALNAEMMRNSPWTKLGGEAAKSQDKIMSWLPGNDFGKSVAQILGAQSAANTQDAQKWAGMPSAPDMQGQQSAMVPPNMDWLSLLKNVGGASGMAGG